MTIQARHFEDLKDRIFNNLPTFYSESQVMNDIYNALVPEFERIKEFLVTPDVREDNVDDNIQEEIDTYIDNRMGWGFERFVMQFSIIGSNHFLEEISALYGTLFETDYIELRNRLLLYAAFNRSNNEYDLRRELDFIGMNLISSIITTYALYTLTIDLNTAGNDETLAIAQRQFDQIFPAHLSIVFTSALSKITLNDNPLKTLNDTLTYTIG